MCSTIDSEIVLTNGLSLNNNEAPKRCPKVEYFFSYLFVLHIGTPDRSTIGNARYQYKVISIANARYIPYLPQKS